MLKQGAVLVDPSDEAEEPRLLVYLEHAVQDGRTTQSGDRRVVSRRFEFVELTEGGQAREAGWAPYLDCRPITSEERALLGDLLDEEWLTRPQAVIAASPRNCSASRKPPPRAAF